MVGAVIDAIHYTLGEYTSSNHHLQIQRPNQRVLDAGTRATIKNVISDVPDLVSVHGTLQRSQHVTEGASLVVNFRSGPPFPGTLPLIWTIQGDKGTIRVTSERGPIALNADSSGPIPIEVHDHASGEVKIVEWEWEEWQVGLPAKARNIGKVYDLLWDRTEGRLGDVGGLVDFEAAVARHKQLDGILW